MKLLGAVLLAACASFAGAVDLPSGFDAPGERFVLPPPPAPAAAKPLDDETTLPPEEQQTNFKYGEISQRLKKIVIGRGKGRKAAKDKVWPKVADRVEKGEIHFIVVHSAMGSCNGAIGQMETHHAAAHFMVCKDGSVTRLVDIKNITLHVKNEKVNDASVGIETETGTTYKKGKKIVSEFLADDWDPDSKWKMYSSLAWLIRAVAEETKVSRAQWGSRDTSGIIGHLESDLGIPDGHTDPGPDFYGKTFPAFEDRFPGQSVTPQKYLMMLVGEDAPPKIVRLTRTGGSLLRVSDSAKAGVAKVILVRMENGKAGKPPLLTWLPPAQGLPPGVVDLPVPTEPGNYRVQAFDLVGNSIAGHFTVDPAAAGALELKLDSAAIEP